MAIQINEISEKYINKLGKSYFNTVKLSEAASYIKMAVKETAEAAKREIENAIEPLKAKIAEKDEFISSQTKINEGLKDENEELKQSAEKTKEYVNSIAQAFKSSNQTIKSLQTKIDEYKPIIKEAYKHDLTQDIRDKKNAISSLLSTLLHHKEEQIKPKSTVQQVAKAIEKVVEKPIEKSVIEPQKTIQKSNKIVKAQKPMISPTVEKEIEAQRKNQKLDSVRVNKAQKLIKEFLEDAPQKDSYSSVQEHFKKTMNRYLDFVRSIISGRYRFEKDSFSKIRIGTDENGRVVLKERGHDFDGTFHSYNYEIFNKDGTSMEIYDGNADSYIKFSDSEGEDLLKICYGDHYSAIISDKNGRLMIAEGIKDGVVKYLNVNFNEVKSVKEIENDETMNAYAQDLINKAKKNCTKKEKSYKDTTDIDYINSEGKRTVHEYYVNKKNNPTPVYTYLYNSETGNPEKIICTADFGLHGKIVDDGYGKPKIIQYRTKGITGIDKKRENSDLKDFRIGFYKSTENEHFEVQSLYDKNYTGDKDSILQREVYEKRNYGLASKPLTRAFTFYDLTKHKIKPWDFSILKPYV